MVHYKLSVAVVYGAGNVASVQVSYVALDPSDGHAELLFSGCVLAETAMWQCVCVCHSMRC